MGSHFMLNLRNRHTAEREKIIGEAIGPVVAELRLVDVVDYVAFLRMEHFGNIADIVNSSSQLYMKTGTLKFGNEGEVHLAWGGPPSIDLAMIFQHQGVNAHFRLGLTAATASVSITFISFEETEVDPEINTAQLQAAVDGARLASG